ncbi:hypothetical protein ACM66B_001803 [Microbotryomycetes sp. NB124-2]
MSTDRAQELLRLRELLISQTPKGKAKPKSQHDNTTTEHKLTSGQVEAGFKLALHTITSGPSPAVSSATANTICLNAMDVISLLLQRVTLEIDSSEGPELTKSLSPEFLMQLANALYTTWDSGPTLLMHKCRSTLGPLLDLCDLMQIRQVKEYLRDRTLLEPWHSKRTINTFITMQSHFEMDELKAFCTRPDEPVEVGVLRRLTEAMTTADEVSAAAGTASFTWIERVWMAGTVNDLFWVLPVADGCRKRGVAGRNNVCLHLLPAIIAKQKKKGLEALLEQGELLKPGLSNLQAALEVLEVGNMYQLLHIGDAQGTTDKYSVPHALLDQCLQTANPALRCSAFSLLVMTTAIAAPLPSASLDHIRTFFVKSLGEEDSSFRMSCQSLSGRLLIRLRASAWKARRRADKVGDAEARQYVENVHDFVQWWSDFLFANLNPAKPFRTKMSAIRLLDLLFQANLDAQFAMTTQSTAGNDPTAGYSTYRRVVPTHLPQFQAKHRKIDDGSSVGALSDDSGAWPFAVQLVNASTTFALLRQMNSTYTALRALALSLLERFPSPLPGYEGAEGEARAKQDLLAPALKMIQSGRDAEASAGAGVIGLVWRKWSLEGDFRWQLSEIGSWNKLKMTEGPAGFSFINGLMDLLETQIATYRQDLAHAASTTPMHGTILALRHLFVSIPLPAFDRLSTADERRALFVRALRLVESVWDVTSPVLAASAPEGTAELEAQAADTEEARAVLIAETDGDGADDIVEGTAGHGGPMHKIILSATWRAIKEAGELLETILRLPTELGPDAFKQVWTLEDVKHIGALFAEWLARIRHRGGYMAVSPCYARASAALLSCKGWSEVSELPFEWLAMHIDSIVADDVSTTRRSAGVPFCIVGLLIVMMPVDLARAKKAFERLFEIAESKSTDIRDSSRVHAMNTLRTAILDAKCAALVTPYIERGFLVSVALFWSSNWICRNVAMLTYSALVTRAFTSRRINLKRDHQALQHRLTADDFFGRFPALHAVLLRELEYCSREHLDDLPTSDLHSSLFSILMLLSLIQTTNRVDPTSSSPSDVFIPIVRKCAKSRVWKIRDVAGDALTGLVPTLQVASVCVDILSDLEGKTENEMHGKLVQVLRVLQAAGPLPLSDLSQLHGSIEKLAPMLLDGKHSFAVGATLFDIARICATLQGYRPTVVLEHAYKELESARSWPRRAAHLPSAENFVAAAFSLALLDDNNMETLLRAGLASPFLEVQRRALALSETAPTSTLQGLKADLLKLASADEAASECRIAALEQLLRVSWDDDSAELESNKTLLLERRERTAIVPLREALLPLIARMANATKSASEALDLIDAASNVHQSIESRESAIKALNELRDPVVVKSERFCRLLLRLLQDDDPAVRDFASEVVAREWHNGSAVCERRAVEAVLFEAGPPSFAEVKDEFDEDLAELRKPTSLLFAIERPNIFKDDLLESEISAQAYAEGRSHLKDIAIAVGKTQGPLGPLGKDSVCKWAFRLTKANTRDGLIEVMSA